MILKSIFNCRILILIVLMLIIVQMSYALASVPTAAERISMRLVGPFHNRFILQPLMAIILGIRDGRMDASLSRPPYLLDLITDAKNRIINLRKGLESLLIPLSIGIILDAAIQFVLFDRVRILGAIILGIIVIGLPYSLSRGLSNRLKSKSND